MRKAITSTAVSAVIMAVGILGFGLARSIWAGGVASEPRSGPSSHRVGASQPVATVALKLPGDTYQLTYDPQGDSLWFSVMSPAGPGTLYRYTLSDGSLDDWALPDSDGNGFFSEIRLGPDGSVWINQDYRVIRFEPSTGHMTSIDLELQVKGAMPGALDPGDPLPGTWVSGIAPDGGGALIARNHVPFLTRLSSDLQLVGQIPLPDGFDGARDVASLPTNSIAVLSGPSQGGELAVLSSSGLTMARTEVSDLRGNARLVVDAAQGLILVAGARALGYTLLGLPSTFLNSGGSGFAWWVATDPQGGLVVYDYLGGSIDKIKAGAITADYKLPAVAVTGDFVPEPIAPDQSATAASPSQQAFADPDVRGIAVDSRGTTWFVVGRDGTLVRLDL
jgi:hypothetical protein